MMKNCNIYLRPHSIQLEVRALLIDFMEEKTVFSNVIFYFGFYQRVEDKSL